MSTERPQREPGAGELVLVRPRERVRRPPLYRVLLHNDDYTPREFVVAILLRVFRKEVGEAQQLMLHAHRHGVAIVARYPREVAELKVDDAMQAARAAEMPLQFTMEPDEDEDDADGQA